MVKRPIERSILTGVPRGCRSRDAELPRSLDEAAVVAKQTG